MAISIMLPELNVGDAIVKVSAWFVVPGDVVELGDRVVEVQLPGITFDVSAPAAGIFKNIEAPIETVVTTGEILGWLET